MKIKIPIGQKQAEAQLEIVHEHTAYSTSRGHFGVPSFKNSNTLATYKLFIIYAL